MSYEKIIDMPHPKSKKHYPMLMYNRAAQFAPFVVLSGYGEAVSETARLTDSKIEIDEDRAADLDTKTRLLIEHADEKPQISIKYFVPDKRKSGGAYHSITGTFRWFDEYSGNIVLCGGVTVSIDDIYRIDGNFFDKFALTD